MCSLGPLSSCLRNLQEKDIDKGVLLRSVLLNMEESNELPDDPQQVLIDYFGEYR